MMEPLDLNSAEKNPLSSLDVWEDDLLERYPDPNSIVAENDGRVSEL